MYFDLKMRVTIERNFIYRIGGEVRSFYTLLGFLAVRLLCGCGLFHILDFLIHFSSLLSSLI